MITKDLVHVALIESERGFGQKIDEIKEFRGYNAQAEAEAFVKEFNSKNDQDQVPDWYMYAKIMSYRDPITEV